VELLDQRCNRLVHEREVNVQNQMVRALAGPVPRGWPPPDPHCSHWIPAAHVPQLVLWEARNRPRRMAEDIPLDEEMNEAERLRQYQEQMADARAAIGQKLAKLRLAQVRLGTGRAL